MKDMDARLGEQIQLSPDAILVDVGTERGLHGRTRVVLSPEGGAIETFRDGKHEEFPIRISFVDVRRLLDLVAESATTRPALKRPPVPDEPRYHIIMRRAGSVLFDTDLWRSQVEQDPNLARVITELQELVHQRSEGRALL